MKAQNLPYRPCVGIMLFNQDGKVFVGKRIDQTVEGWQMPQGGIDKGENPKDAALRELKEETALKITDIKFVIVQDCISSKEFYRDAHFVLLNYTCKCIAKNPRVVLNEEAREFQWLPLKHAKKLKLNKPTKILLAAVEQYFRGSLDVQREPAGSAGFVAFA